MTPAEDELAANIRRQRALAGLTLRVVADACDVRLETVHRWETGARRPSAIDVAHLARALRCSVTKLLPGREALDASRGVPVRPSLGVGP